MLQINMPSWSKQLSYSHRHQNQSYGKYSQLLKPPKSNKTECIGNLPKIKNPHDPTKYLKLMMFGYQDSYFHYYHTMYLTLPLVSIVSGRLVTSLLPTIVLVFLSTSSSSIFSNSLSISIL